MSYIAYKCYDCQNTFLLLSDEIKHSEEESNYISCPYNNNHKKIYVTGKYSNLKKCMDHDSYERVRGRLRQRK